MAEGRALTFSGKLIATWGVVGVLAILIRAIWKLTPIALEPVFDGSMSSFQWFIYGAWTLINAYAEGYRGFQKAFSPRVVARAVYLGHNPKPLHVVFAPVFCMAMFHATRKRLIVAWVLLLGIVGLVIIVRMLPQPWRGIVDAGVVLGLIWGSISIVVMFARALFSNVVPDDDSIPEPAPSAA
jgi:hypothetical protein